ncbi:MAG TPA: cytochrome c biogenesis protein ResB [Deltaproteobacteria bacterium]|nr:cytochrome c biogenesis protein ResB [Deltaproteobacteria bacterium]
MGDKIDETAREAASRGAFQALGQKIWAFFNSLKLTLFVLITLAVVSIIGTVVQQGQPPEQYVMEYGERWAAVITALNLNDMYHSTWFIALLALLAMNVVVCTLERFPPKWKAVLGEKSFDAKVLSRLSNRRTVAFAGGVDEACDAAVAALKARRYRFKVIETGEGRGIYAWKGVIGRFGSDLTHVSLIVILVGAIVGSFYGYKDFKSILVGGVVRIPNADFSLRLDKFWIDYYDTGQIRQYNSLLTVMEDGREVLQKQIWVNEPLTYKGISFYQSSYGMAWNRISEAELMLKKKDKEEFEPPFKVKWFEKTAVPGTDYEVRLVEYVADFAFDEKLKVVYSKSPEARNPAARVEIYRGGRLVASPWLFFNYPGLFSTIPETEDDLVFAGFRQVPYSGISINKDPGANIVWVGTAIMGLGFYLAFFVYHRRLWVEVRPAPSGAEIRLGGLVNKNRFVMERELNEIAGALEAGGRGSSSEV